MNGMAPTSIGRYLSNFEIPGNGVSRIAFVLAGVAVTAVVLDYIWMLYLHFRMVSVMFADPENIEHAY